MIRKYLKKFSHYCLIILLVAHGLQARVKERYMTRAICQVDITLEPEEYDATRPVMVRLIDTSNPGYQLHHSNFANVRERAITWTGRLGQISPLRSSRNVSLLLHVPFRHNIMNNIERDDWECQFRYNNRILLRAQVQTEKIKIVSGRSGNRRNRTYDVITDPSTAPNDGNIICAANELQIHNNNGCVNGAMCLRLTTGVQSCRCIPGFAGANCQEMQH